MKFYNPTTKRIGTVNAITLKGRPAFIANYVDEYSVTSSRIRETFEQAKKDMEKYGYFPFPLESVPGEITTKEKLFGVIRKLTAAGYMFEIRNYYQGGKADRAGYMVHILSHKSE